MTNQEKKIKLSEELVNAGINLNSSREYVRWDSKKDGIRFSSLNDFRAECGHEALIGDLDFVVPSKDLFS